MTQFIASSSNDHLSLSPHPSPSLSYSIPISFFMQHPKNSNTARKRWYERVIEATTLWKALSKPIEFPISSPPWKTKTTQLNDHNATTAVSSTWRKLRKCSSTKAAASSSFSHVYCLCAPISSSYTDIFQTNVVVPRRSCTYARSRSLSSSSSSSRSRSRSTGEKINSSMQSHEGGVVNNNGRMSIEGRKIFRGKSLRDDVLMRRFVVDEEEMKMKMKVKVRRRNEMEVIRRRSGMRRNKIGPSPLSRMLLAT